MLAPLHFRWGKKVGRLSSFDIHQLPRRRHNDAQAKDSQRHEEAVPPVRQGQSEAPFVGNEPSAGSDVQQAKAKSSRDHECRHVHAKSDPRRPKRQQQLELRL